MVEEKIILQVLTEQRDEKNSFDTASWVARREESLIELDSPLAQIVIGVRRSGKSTLCHKVLIENRINYGYANLDDDRLASMKTEDLNTLLSCIYQIYGTDIKYLFLDEIQNVDGWHLFVNRLLRNNMRVIVTGSNAKLLSGELATHLTGRYNEIRLFPFSFLEYCRFHHINTTSITTKALADRQQAFMDYINNGGFPEIQSLHNKRGYVQSLIEAILIKDIQYRYQVRSTDALRKIAHHLISNSCHIINYGELASLLGISDKTVKKYVEDRLQRQARYGKGASRQYGGHYTWHPQVPEYPMRDILAPRFGQRIQQICQAETHLAGNQGQKTTHDNRRKQDGKTN